MFQYAFRCNEEERVTQISTLIPVNDGKIHIVHIRWVLLSYLINFTSVCCARVRFTLFVVNKILLQLMKKIYIKCIQHKLLHDVQMLLAP